MRFKLFFNEQKNKLEINCLNDNKNKDIILPDDPEQHLYFPIPNTMKKDISAKLETLISDEVSAEFIALGNEIKALTDRRREMVNELRKKINPEIMEKCEEFRAENAEHFI